MLDAHDIENRFTYHPPVGQSGELHELVREKARALADDLNALVPDGREKSLAITHLEETVMWANAAIARNPRH